MKKKFIRSGLYLVSVIVTYGIATLIVNEPNLAVIAMYIAIYGIWYGDFE